MENTKNEEDRRWGGKRREEKRWMGGWMDGTKRKKGLAGSENKAKRKEGEKGRKGRANKGVLAGPAERSTTFALIY